MDIKGIEMGKPKIVALAGSARKDSFNAKLIRIAVAGATDAGADVTLVDMNEFPLPIFNQDLEQAEGAPENATQLKNIFVQSQGILIASPEYNSSVTPLLKNTIDWISRPAAGEPPLVAFTGKIAGLLAASPGGLGGLRGLVHLRSILGNIGVIVLPEQMAIPRAMEAFDDDGNLKEDFQQTTVMRIGKTVAETAAKLAD
jgi:NAD(P)H-dependent FMN reductase